MFFMLGLSVFLMASVDSRFHSVAWGNVLKQCGEDISVDGFLAVDLSDTVGLDMQQTVAELEPSQKAAFAAQLFTESDISPQMTAIEDKKVSLIPHADNDVLVADPVKTDVAVENENAVEVENELPAAPEAIENAVVTLPLLNEPTGDFGPLPKDLADYESIVLNTTDNGMQLPNDSIGAEMDLELPDDVVLENVGPGWKEHIVKAGETLSDIAMAYGQVTAQDILRANGLKDANRLTADQIILVPNSSELIEDTLEEVRIRQARVAALREQVVPLKAVSYVVAQGDSLWSIANSQNVEVDTLVGSNVFKSSTLRPGMVLRVPNQDGIFYTLKKDDTIESICKRYQVSVEKVRKVNTSIDDIAALAVGSEIFLPSARPEAVAEVRLADNRDKNKDKDRNSKTRLYAKEKSDERVTKSSRNFRWPVMGRINSPFGWRRHPITKRRDFHTGLDIQSARNTVIRSSKDGRVVYAGWMGGYGKVLVIEHNNGQSTLYAHCSSLLVKQGMSISVGQNIARVGTTGRSTGPHLHFEVRNGNSPVNPLKYLR